MQRPSLAMPADNPRPHMPPPAATEAQRRAAPGPQIIAIPGPSPLPPRVQRAMHRASPDIYADDLAVLNLNLMARLKWLAGTRANLAPFMGNGHAGWEGATANLFNRGDKALVLASGHFGRSWAETTRAQGVDVEILDFGLAPADPARLAERLVADKDRAIRAVMLCQTDTASSATADIPAMRAAMGDHPALLVVDAIASLGCAPMRMDDWGVDVLIAASQKGLMAPPGTCFLWFSDRAAARGVTDLTTPYWNWHLRAGAEALWRFWGGTPPVQQIFGLREALVMIEEEGLESVWHRHALLARATWAALDAWGAGNPGIGPVVADPARRSPAVTAAMLPGADRLRDWTERHAGVVLGIGLGAADPANALRIAHMGYTNAAMLMGTLGAIEAGMTALSIPRGRGALEAAATVLATA